MKYILRAASFTLPDSDINVDVIAYQETPVLINQSIACPPIPAASLPPDWTNEQLLAVVANTLKLPVELPVNG